jgi:hypothetical protein
MNEVKIHKTKLHSSELFKMTQFSQQHYFIDFLCSQRTIGMLCTFFLLFFRKKNFIGKQNFIIYLFRFFFFSKFSSQPEIIHFNFK